MTTTATATAALGKCVACAKTYRASSYAGTYNGSCEDCRIGDWTPRIRWSRVKGTVTATECDEACRSAKGDACACACGGDSHGAAHGLQW